MRFFPKAALRVLMVLPMFVGVALVPTAAHADLYMSSPGAQLKPAGSAPRPGAVTPMATSQRGLFTCSNTYVTVANAPSGLATGNCHSGWSLRRTSKSDVVSDTGKQYDGGFITGNYAGCGWIETTQDTLVDGNQSFSSCPFGGVSISEADFSSGRDGCSGYSGCAGTPRLNPSTCNEWANFRPWLSGQGLDDQIRSLGANAKLGDGTPRLAWRYRAKYTATNGLRYVMVRDRAVSPGDGNWVFVSANCMGL